MICLLLALATAANGESFAGATADERAQQHLTIIVNGRALAGVNSSPQQRSGRLFLPLASIAGALGDAVNVEADVSLVKVRRQTGIEAEFDARLNQIRENGSVVLVVSSSPEIAFPLNPAELMLPVEIISELLGASIRRDDALKAIVITRGQTPVETVKDGTRHSVFELYRADYEYSLNRYASSSNQNLILSAAGRIADGRFTLFSSLSGAAKTPNFRNGTFIFERAGGQKFGAGDFGSGTDLPLMSATVRGVWAQIPFGGVRLTAFGGRSNSGAVFPTATEPDGFEPPIGKRARQQYDTNIFGVYASFGTSGAEGRSANPFTFSSGATRFASRARSGEILTGGAQFSTSRLRLQADAAAGRFSGYRGGARVEGFGAATELAGTLQLFENLSVQGRFVFTGKNFLSPQSGQREPVKLAAGGIAWQPIKWLAASIAGSTSVRPNEGGEWRQRDRFITTTLNLTPPRLLPKIFFSHTESVTPQIRRASFTLLSASKDFSRWNLFINASRIKTFGAASLNGQLGANFRLNDSNAFEVSQSVVGGGKLNGFIDWQGSNFFGNRLNLGAGFGYAGGGGSSTSISQRLSAALRLPRQNLLQVSYLQSSGAPTLLVSVRGSLFKKRRAEETFPGAPVSEINSYGSFSGRVYQDVNLDGKFDAGIDQPQANVKVRVDGNRYVESDANGLFNIDSVKSGQHRIYLDLLSVRADLTLLDGAEQTAELLPGRDAVVDFRLVRTGRISGLVWLDTNENGKMDENEPALADVRIVCGNGRDTLTDVHGSFVIGDLPPGEYVILADEKTLPEKTKSARPPVSLKVLAARETGNANFPVVAVPAEVKRFAVKAKE